MARSPICSLKTEKADKEAKSNILHLESERHMTLTITLKGKKETTIYIGDLCYFRCNPKNGYPTYNRNVHIKSLYKFLSNKKQKKYSDESIYQFYIVFRPYLTYCDSLGVSPFSDAGYLSYVGSNGDLWRLVEIYESRKQDYFEYRHGDEIGIKESSAATYKNIIDEVLINCGFNIVPFQHFIKAFKRDNTSDTKPYTYDELSVLIKRLSLYFTSLANQLIDHQRKCKNTSPPEKLTVVVEKQNNETVHVIVGQNKGRLGPSSPLHQCMAAAYLLFSYFTAFNKTSILELRHPIKETKSNDKTSKLQWIKAYKGRSHKDVKALFSNDVTGQTHPNLDLTSEGHTSNEVGFITAPIQKREALGINNGLEFINKLQELSLLYSGDKYGKLFFSIDSQGQEVPLHISNACAIISENLGLFSSSRGYLTEYFINLFNQVQNQHRITEIKTEKNDSNTLVISKQVKKLHKNGVKRKSIELAFAAMSCMTSLPLRNIVMPLLIQDDKEDLNKIVVSFNYSDGKKGLMITEKAHKQFLLDLENYARNFNALPKVKKGRGTGPAGTTRPPFLLPLGIKGATYQWQGVESIITSNSIRSYGIRTENFFLSLSAAKLRLTTSDQEYNESDRGHNARIILQNERQTFDKSYLNGHPVENKKMISEGIQVIQGIARGKSLNESKDEVKSTNKIEVLSYEKYKFLKSPTNANGIHCNGKPQIEGQKDYHYTAKKFAQKKSIIKDDEDITCYQLDLCIFCKSAKLVDDPHSVYKLICFIEALQNSLDLLPYEHERLLLKIKQFELLLEQISSSTLEKAINIRFKKGVYFLFSDERLILNFVSGASKYD